MRLSGFTIMTKKNIKDAAEDDVGKLEKPTIYKYSFGNYERKIMWKEEIYREWYEYAKLQGVIDTFDDWFDPNLFAEPLKENAVSILSRKGNKLVIEINLTYDLHRLITKLTNIVTRYSKKNIHTCSRAQYQPSKAEKDISVTKLSERRKTYGYKQRGKSNLMIAMEMGYITEQVYEYKIATKGMSNKEKASVADEADFLESQYLKAERKVQRDIKQCEDILKQVAKGTFP